ncbi:hypothetical protein SAMN02927900_04233 [Rhizobium mongolense subsp. loessense]|uniref:Uncharacterized protein n=1 Tax=Rhizobium mongolense subsp. loessense TaxID=158890 RepID=A0A1G4SV27_9HYPH|nr:hypothetical protein [Rhizobium mongolense]SCW72978.1 hypothetical protein SAMN02927900_04233 [Rhizobium mongolense subsp. loessense]
MAVDWFATLAEQGDIAKSKEVQVTTLLAMPSLPIEMATLLYSDVEKGAQAFGRILSEMENADIDDELLEAADTLADIWSRLSVASVNKVRELQGLPVITGQRAINSRR